MFKSERFTYRETNCFSDLICEYIEQHPDLQPYYGRFPDIDSFGDQMEKKAAFSTEKRQLLINRLKDQYQGLSLDDEAGAAFKKSIEKLSDPQGFTVVTGHQLNLFTGPLYFVYKIISCIKLCRRLEEEYPDRHFVPLYWMASEDHDFEEINYINLYGGRLLWERQSGGPVGRFKTAGVAPLIDELEEHLGPGSNLEELTTIFRRAYNEDNSLAQATRTLVHELFGMYGLICIDGDDPELKRQMIPFFSNELRNQGNFKVVDEVTTELEALHFKQVHPRPINLFYILDGIRERIEKHGSRWQVLNTDISFDENELEEELNQHPERFSPNVILRPLYQEVILPNLAYIGGGGELAYWLQLKEMFAKNQVPFPLLVLRNSVLWIKSKHLRKMEKLGLNTSSLFQPLHEIQKEFVSEGAPVEPSLSPYEQKLKKIFDELEEVARLTDDSMLGAVNAQRAKQLNGLENLRKKLIRAEKRRRSDEMEQIERLYLQLFPKHSLQERHDNLSLYYKEYGSAFAERLLEELDPLDFRFTVIVEKDPDS